MRPLLAAPLFASLAGAVLGATTEKPLSFNQDIRPILSDKCFACHGFDAKERKADRRLDTAEGAYAVLDGVQAIAPGDPEKSEAWLRIASTDKDEVMPPADFHKPLTAAEKAKIKRWIEEGAAYQKHWAFEAPAKPVVPAPAGLNPIDSFIAARLKREGLALSPEADRETLIRRVSFALTGLPPTVREADDFIGDTGAGAYGRMVDRYLASPRFGEEMARHWLDVARYADTHGLHLDNERQMWAYRDWVVRAFNENLSFDRFTTWQLAGDLLPNATRDQLIATGFNRCNVTTSEGGSIPEEFIYRYAVDRASTTMEAWMGLTGGCAVCHDHKFDPLSTKEFYSFYSFFHSSADPAMDGNALLTKPTLRLSTPEQDRKLAELDAKLVPLRKAIDAKLAKISYTDPATIKPPPPVSETETVWIDDGFPAGAKPQASVNTPRTNAVTDPSRSYMAWQKSLAGKDTPGVPVDLNKLLKAGYRKDRKPADEKRVRDYYFQYVCAETKPLFGSLITERDAVQKERDAFDKDIPNTFIWSDLEQPRESFVMVRGQYDKPGEKVEPGVPAVLPALNKAKPDGRATRLDLAKWLISAEHPLTARVTVNRFWQQFFGTGLVKTSFDFGSQGEPPSHPELLDWLAIHFQESKWDVKKFAKLLLTSATFRQSSAVSAEQLKRDPENRLYARGPRFRLDAEQLRDNALYVSGLINLEMGGKGVRTYQPPNIWEPVGFGGSNTRFYTQDKGPALYRRSLYSFLKRTAPPPFMANFDAPNREQSCSRRERSNTPLQALQLMNDVQHFEAARAFAERILLEGGETPAERITYAYRMALARKPAAEEVTIVQQALDQHLASYRQDAEAAKKVITNGESKPKSLLPEADLAAWTLVANLVLNLDETLTRN